VSDEEWHGYWTRPDTGATVGGRLVLDDHGLELVLYGSFFVWDGYDFRVGVGFPLATAQTVPVIHGQVIEPMTVLGATCDLPVSPFASAGFEVWEADAVIGARVEPPDDGSEPTFTGVQLDLEMLPVWAGARPAERRHWFGEHRTAITIRPHELASGRLPSGEEVTIEQGAGTTHVRLGLEIAMPVRMSIEGCERSTWVELLNAWLQPTQALLWLATARVGRVERVALRLDQPEDHSPKWGQLWFAQLDPPSGTSPDPSPHDVLFFAADLPGGFAASLARWKEIWSELKHILGPLYARAAAPFAYANDRFYTAIAAVEAYHRYCVTSERDLPRLEHRARVSRLDDLLQDEDAGFRTWAVNAAKPFNRIPLWRRIVEIAGTLEAIGHDLFGDDVEAFARIVESARHGHAHALEGESDFQSGEALYTAADALTWLLRACLMIDLGMSLEVVEERIRRHQRFQSTTRRCRRILGALDDQPTTD